MDNEQAEKRTAKTPPEPQPGEKVGQGRLIRKIPWTQAKVEAAFPMVTIVSECTTVISWNGVAYWVIEGQECKLPKPHYDIYAGLVKGKHQPRTSVLIIEGQPVHVLHGAGALRPQE